MPENELKTALQPDALRESVEQILTTPPPDSSGTQIDVAVMRTEQDQGAEVQLTTSGRSWTAAAWAQWLRSRGWAAGGRGSFKWGGKKPSPATRDPRSGESTPE